MSTPRKGWPDFPSPDQERLTGQLREHATLPVLVDSAYGPHEDLSEYSLLICIAGGVGITACVPYLRPHPSSTKLFWGPRSQGIVDAMAASLGDVEQKHLSSKADEHRRGAQ